MLQHRWKGASRLVLCARTIHYDSAFNEINVINEDISATLRICNVNFIQALFVDGGMFR